jgi:MFS family permease
VEFHGSPLLGRDQAAEAAARASLLRDGNVARFGIVRLASGLAAQMQSVAIGWHIYMVTGSALGLGLVGLCQFLPSILLVLVTGHAADRFDRRKIVIVSLLVQATASIALFAVATAPDAQVWPIYVLVTVLGAARAFSMPAFAALLPNIVDAKLFPRAVAFSSIMNELAMLAGPAAGGLLLLWSGASPFATSAALSLVAVALVAGIRVPPASKTKAGSADVDRLLGGFSYLRSNRFLLGAISLDLFAVLLGGVTALLPIFARDILLVGPAGYGLLRAGPAIGAIIVGASLAHRPLRRHVGAIMLWCVVGYGAATILFALSSSFALSCGAMVALGGFDMVSVVLRQTMVQVATPDEMRGRVSAINSVFIGASNQLGDFESGVAAAFLGAVGAALLGGVGTIAVVLLWAYLFPELRRADKLVPCTRK